MEKQTGLRPISGWIWAALGLMAGLTGFLALMALLAPFFGLDVR